MIPLKRFTARIKLPIGNQTVFIQADNLWNARQMLQAQYGQSSILWGPVEMLHD